MLDFEAWDNVDLQALGYASAAQALDQFSQSGADVVFTDAGTTITFTDTTLAMFTADNVWV